MAFTVTFPATTPCPDRDTVEGWLADHGEPFELEGAEAIHLRALPVRFIVSPDQQALQAQIEVTSQAGLSRLVDLLFAVSLRAGADVRLAGEGEITREALWLRLSDEQDRLRIAEALARAREHGNHEEITTRLWGVVAALRPGSDDRWDADRERVVQLLEVGHPDGLSVEEASWHDADAKLGDVVVLPVRGMVHTLTWRWLSEAYPGIAE